MPELPSHIEDQIETIWYNYQSKLISGKLAEIKDMINGQFHVNEIITKIEEFNSIISDVSGEDEELYDTYRFRMFTKDCDVILLQHPEVISEVDKQFEVKNEYYDLYGYDEVDVDVRHYGTGEV